MSPDDLSHISDFRKQPRSDSRADRPDVFPNFDFDSESTLPLPLPPPPSSNGLNISAIRHKTEFYTHIVRKLIERRVGKIIENVGQRRRKAKQNWEATTEFVGLSLEDDADDDDFGASTTTTAQSFLARLGNNAKQNIRNRIASSATYVINPLFHIWNAATRNLNSPAAAAAVSADASEDDTEELVKWGGGDGGGGGGNVASAEAASVPDHHSNDDMLFNDENNKTDDVRRQQQQQQQQDIQEKATTIESSNDGKLMQTRYMAFPVGTSNIQSTNVEKNNNNNVAQTRTKLALENAFSLTVIPKRVANASTLSALVQQIQSISSVAHRRRASAAHLNSTNKNSKHNNNGTSVDYFEIERDGESKQDVGENIGGNEAEGVGIFVLEIFGTIVGLWWGALTQLQQFLGQT